MKDRRLVVCGELFVVLHIPTMNAVGGHASLGLNWYTLLSIYSTLGSDKSKKIENELKTLKSLNGAVVKAIQSINTQLGSLIKAGSLKLSGDNMTELKKSIVEGLKGHVAANSNKCADPVVCDGDSILFTDDVKEILASLVTEKARVLQEVDLRKMARDISGIEANITDVKNRVKNGLPLTDSDTSRLNEWFHILEKNDTELATIKDAIGKEISMADAERLLASEGRKTIDEKQESLTKAIEANTETVASCNPEALTTSLREIFEGREGLSEADHEALAKAVVEKMATTDDPETDAFKEALAKAVVEKMVQNASTVGPSSRLSEDELNALAAPLAEITVEPDEEDRPPGFNDELPPGFNEELYMMTTAEALHLFQKKDGMLDVRLNFRFNIGRKVMSFSEYAGGKTKYRQQSELTSKTLLDHAMHRWSSQMWFRLKLPDEEVTPLSNFVDKVISTIPNDISRLQAVHHFLLTKAV
jgi:hypothetical protein